MMSSNTTHPLHNFFPYRLVIKDELLCQWMQMGEMKFTEPFFEETILKCRHVNSNPYLPTTSIEGMIEGAAGIAALEPAAFIFHVSRCGSTLLSQLLSLDEQHIVLSEVPLLDELLRVHRGSIPQGLEDEALKAAIKLLGQERTGNEKLLFVKLDSWHIFYWKKLRELYPRVPFILLYRSPAEVVRSHRKHRGLQMVPGLLDPALLGLPQQEATNPKLDEYSAKVLECFYKGFIEISRGDSNTILVNYEEGIMSIMHRIAAYTGIAFSQSTLRDMEQRSSFHSKHPGKAFSEHTTGLPGEPWLERAFALYTEVNKVRDEAAAAIK